MAYLIPPMDDEPPPGYITFVSDRLAALRSETARLMGGDRYATEVYMEVLTDLAGHWRRLCWRSRLSHRDAPAEFLDRRLATRTKQWREDQIYPVEVSVLRPPRVRPTTPPGDDTHSWTATGPQAQTQPESAWLDYYRPGSASATDASPPPTARAPVATIAQQLAPLLPTTTRAEVGVVAEAEIAWVHAYRRYVWRRYCRIAGGIVLLIGYLVQFMSQFSAPS